MFELITSKPKEKINYNEIYLRIFHNALESYKKDSQDSIKRIVFYGLKYINTIEKTEEQLNCNEIQEQIEITDAIKLSVSQLTPNELVTIFPIEKDYDGHKYGCKDYFYTIEKIKEMGLDKIIGNKIEDLLFDYQNKEIRDFSVYCMMLYSDLMKIKTGKGIMERWAEENHLTTYKTYKDETTGKEYIYNTKTCKTKPIRKRTPRYLKILK